MKVVLIHGKDTDPTKKWYPWLAGEMQKRGIEFITPHLPNSADPIMKEWINEIDETNPDEHTILIGHSRGGVAILRWMEQLPENKKVKKVILVATNSGLTEDKPIASESNKGFYTENGYNFEKIKRHCDKFIVLHSKDDTWVPFSAGEKNASGLDAKFLQFTDRGHFGNSVNSIPELLEEIESENE